MFLFLFLSPSLSLCSSLFTFLHLSLSLFLSPSLSRFLSLDLSPSLSLFLSPALSLYLSPSLSLDLSLLHHSSSPTLLSLLLFTPPSLSPPLRPPSLSSS